MRDLKLQNIFAANSSVNLDTKHNLIASLRIPQALNEREEKEKSIRLLTSPT